MLFPELENWPALKSVIARVFTDRYNQENWKTFRSFMFKLPFILVLVATQLLVGSSRAVYLCIKADGGVCCLDAGPDACVCHHEHLHTALDADCDHAQDHPQSGKSHECDHKHGRHELPSSRQDEHLVMSSLTGGCTHQLVSTGHTASIAKSTVSHDVLDALQFLGTIPAILAVDPQEWHCAEGAWRKPPLMPSATLMALSTINMRC